MIVLLNILYEYEYSENWTFLAYGQYKEKSGQPLNGMETAKNSGADDDEKEDEYLIEFWL